MMTITELRDSWTEAQFQAAVIEMAHAFGWRVAHFRTVAVHRKDGSVYYATPVQADGEGFPDLELVRDRVVHAELKSARGRVSIEQEGWHFALVDAGAEAYIWRPRDLDEIERVLGKAGSDACGKS